MHRTSTLAAFALILTGCVTYHSGHSLGANDYVLASREGQNGRKETYELRESGTSLRITDDYARERPFLGFKLVELNKQHAEQRGVQPFTGLLVMGSYPGSSAMQGGVMTGDVLLSLDKNKTVYLAQVAEFESRLHGEQVVTATVLRGQEELDLSLSTDLLKERVTDSQDIELESVPHQQPPYAGVTLRGIPAVWCEKIFGQKRNAVVVASVEVGSPSWLAGVRPGDIIDTVDGSPVPPVAELSPRLHAQGEVGQSMQWGVRRGPGPGHEAAIELEDYSGEGNVWVPFICRLENGTYMDRWSLGPFGLLMSNRNHYVADQATRAVKTRNVFSAVLGLFRVESTPEETEVRLLWFIHFDT